MSFGINFPPKSVNIKSVDCFGITYVAETAPLPDTVPDVSSNMFVSSTVCMNVE